jgi:hypothetical protein
MMLRKRTMLLLLRIPCTQLLYCCSSETCRRVAAIHVFSWPAAASMTQSSRMSPKVATAAMRVLSVREEMNNPKAMTLPASKASPT